MIVVATTEPSETRRQHVAIAERQKGWLNSRDSIITLKYCYNYLATIMLDQLGTPRYLTFLTLSNIRL